MKSDRIIEKLKKRLSSLSKEERQIALKELKERIEKLIKK